MFIFFKNQCTDKFDVLFYFRSLSLNLVYIMKYAVIDTLFNLKVGSERVVLTGEKFLEIVQQVRFCTTKFTLSEMTPKF